LEITSSKLSFRISMVNLDELKPHEEVIDPVVGSLANDVLEEGELRDPLVVDQEDYVILDGMHRFNSLRLLKCRFVPCCLVDYDNPLITVGAWFRLFAVDEAERVAERLLRDAGLHYSLRKVELAKVSNNSQTIMLTKTSAAFSLPDSTDLFQLARTAANLEKTMVKNGHAVTYSPETTALQKLQSNDLSLIISVPIFSKQQIREFGVMGHLLPHKTTRHVIPSRPLRVDVPLKMLTDPTISREEADRKLGELLAQKHVERKPPGSIVDGRRYEEELLIFTP
jgi:L-serine kinase (ADP)